MTNLLLIVDIRRIIPMVKGIRYSTINRAVSGIEENGKYLNKYE